jgi:hypothetical protein
MHNESRPMPDEIHATYPPLNTLKPVADDVWIVDGPLIRFRTMGLNIPFPTRATIIRLEGSRLFVHSPTPLTESLKAEIDKTGAPRWIIGPNRLHYWWIPEWRDVYPEAEVYLAPRIKEQAGQRLDFDCRALERPSGDPPAYPWDREIMTLSVPGAYMTEFVFFHAASKTLVLTDLIENFESAKLGFMMRLLCRIGGVRDPDGSTPSDLRRTFRKQGPQVKAAVETMIGWNPERIILAHGRWYASDGRAELQRAFRWVLRR